MDEPAVVERKQIVVVRQAALGAGSLGAVALGALALGAVALGAVAIGSLAIGRLAIGRVRIRRLEVDELTVGRLNLLERQRALSPRIQSAASSLRSPKRGVTRGSAR